MSTRAQGHVGRDGRGADGCCRLGLERVEGSQGAGRHAPTTTILARRSCCLPQVGCINAPRPPNSWGSGPLQENARQQHPWSPREQSPVHQILLLKPRANILQACSPKALSLHSLPPNCVLFGRSPLNSVFSRRSFYSPKHGSMAPFPFLGQGLQIQSDPGLTSP